MTTPPEPPHPGSQDPPTGPGFEPPSQPDPGVQPPSSGGTYPGAPQNSWAGQPNAETAQYPGAGQYPGAQQYPGTEQHPGVRQFPGSQPQYPGYPDAQSGPGGPQYPGGGPPPAYPSYPGQPYPSAPGPSAPAAKKSRRLWWVLGVVALLIIAIVVLIGFIARDTVTDYNDVAVGDCVSVSGQSGDQTLHARKTDCSSTSKMTFYVALKMTAGSCPSQNYSRLYWTEGGAATGEQLCLVPNLIEGKCYQIPNSIVPTSSLVDFRQIECGLSGAPGTEVIRIEARTAGRPSCQADQLAVYFALPKPIGYCLAATTAS